MRKRQNIFQSFVLFLLLSVLILVISPNRYVRLITGGIERLFLPLQRSVYINLGITDSGDTEELKRIKEENLQLKAQLIRHQALENDNQALRDQYARQVLPAKQLLPVNIIGTDAILPDSFPTQITINAGNKQRLKKGMAVIYKDILVGIITKVSENISGVTLTTSEKISLASSTQKTGALGILNGEISAMLFDSVLVSEKLEKGDLIITKGSVSDNGVVLPPNLLVGKIAAINKKPSALFQSAHVEPLLDLSRLSTVFVIIQ